MTIHRTAKGKPIDMSALVAKNERTRAVGNMNVNARGDTIDSHGRVIKPVTEKVTEKYAKTVSNMSAQKAKQSTPVTTPKPDTFKEELKTLEPVFEKTKEELEFEQEDEEFSDLEEEKEKNARN